MLIKVSIENYLSIREKQEINFMPAAIKELTNINISQTSFNDLTLLKSIGIFGANSSGKSNILKALEFLKKFVIASIKKQSNEEINVKPFLLHETYENRPSAFEIEFLIDEYIYRYGLIVNRNEVIEEFLSYRKKRKEYLLFQRTHGEYSIGVRLKSNENLKKKTRENVSFLSVLAQFNDPVGIEIVSWFNSMRFIKDEFRPSRLLDTASLYKNPGLKPVIDRLLENADLGFKKIKASEDQKRLKELLLENLTLGIDLSKVGNFIAEYNLKTIHPVYNTQGRVVREREFDISVESAGTQKFMSMIGRIAQVLVTGGVLIIDEIDARLHTFLCQSIIKYFNSQSNNPNSAQLMFITHSTYLMGNELLRRDQICIVEKDEFSSTQLSTLYEHNIRHDANYEKAYLDKKVGGTPKTNQQFNLFPERDLFQQK